jgi:transposase
MTGPHPEIRYKRAERKQVEMHSAALDDLLPKEHAARDVWECIERLDLSRFYRDIQASRTTPGRSPIDPKILLALWVVGTSEGIGSARALAKLCERDIVYQWICGGVGVNHHTLSDFRSLRGNEFDELLTQTVATLMHAGVVTLKTVAQDGMKVRASAGASSFRREPTLQACLVEACAQVVELKKQLDEDPGALTLRQKAARERAARERVERIEAALAEMPKVLEERVRAEKRDKKNAAKKKEPRVSTTDADARVMKMADGGFRPAFNVQFATDVDGQAIVGATVTKKGSDSGEVEAMATDILNRTGELPVTHLVDGGYATAENIEGLASCDVTVLAPVRKPRKEGVDPHARRSGDSDEVAAWRERMATPDAKEEYKDRASTAERVNADMRTRGLTQFVGRGLPKIASCVALFALSFNLMRCTQVIG